jgi:serine phosphatase RsbU (regulator of sigma subunit)
MINKTIIKEISNKTGLPEKTVETIISVYLREKDKYSKKNSDLKKSENSCSAYLLKKIEHAIKQILAGVNPDVIYLPETFTDRSLIKFTENFNRFITQFRNLSAFVQSLASGDLHSDIPEGKLNVYSSLKTINTNIHELKSGMELMVSGDFSRKGKLMKTFSGEFDILAEKIKELMEKNVHHEHELRKANDALIMEHLHEAKDMDMAVTVQRNLMPESPPASRNWEIAYFFEPMSGVSGDFYDFYVNNDDLSGMCLFDVSGHGISSALISMIAKWIIYQSFHKNFNKNFSHVPLNISRDLNAAIGKSEYYLTGVLLKFVGDNIKYINASHPDVLIKKHKSVFPIRKPSGEQPAGLLFGMNIKPLKYEEISCEMDKGDLMLLYTDGFSECRNTSGEQLGSQRLQKILRDSPDGSAQDTLNFLMEKVYKFMKKNSFDDDSTVIVVKKL